MKLRDIGEHAFIQNYISKYINKEILNLDAYSDSEKIYKIDGFSLSYIFPFMDYYDVGWKAVTAVTSDIIVSGGKPSILMASLGVDPDKDVQEVDLLLKGIYEASKYYGFNYIGGDMNSSEKNGWIDIAATGDLLCQFNNKAENGDLVIITDKIGYTSKVFISYLSGFKIDIDKRSQLKVKHPIANKILIRLFSTFCQDVVTATDISDGILISLGNLALRLHKNIKLYDIPIDVAILDVLRRYGYNMMDILKYSGEEYEALIVVRKNSIDKILKFLFNYGVNPIVIGSIENDGNKIFYNDHELQIVGWDNFKGWY